MDGETLGTWTEPAERTPEHNELRADVPAGLTVQDMWHVSVVGVEDVNGKPNGVVVSRLPRVSTTAPGRG